MSYDWKNIYKKEAEQRLENANLSPRSEFGRKFMTFSRRINTLWNKLDAGYTFEALHYLDAYDTAVEILESFKGGFMGFDRTAPYAKEWEQLCDANGFSKDAHLGDWLC